MRKFVPVAIIGVLLAGCSGMNQSGNNMNPVTNSSHVTESDLLHHNLSWSALMVSHRLKHLNPILSLVKICIFQVRCVIDLWAKVN